jgi:hypothetical protein
MIWLNKNILVDYNYIQIANEFKNQENINHCNKLPNEIKATLVTSYIVLAFVFVLQQLYF